jgi:thiamine transporter
MKSDSSSSILSLVFMAFYGALFVVLWYISQFIPFLVMPDGGSIELQYVALFVAAFHLGWKRGLGAGALGFAIVWMLGGEKFFVSPIQYCLDYIIPIVVCAAACLWSGHSKYNYYIGIIVSMLFKWLSNVLRVRSSISQMVQQQGLCQHGSIPLPITLGITLQR